MEATLKIYSVIGTEEDQFSSDKIISFLESNVTATDLIIKIKSPGGSVREGWTIHDLLKNSGKHVKTIAEGELYSIATVIFLAGSEREILPHADGLIHMPRIPNPEGDFQASDLRGMAEYMDQEEEKILDLYVTETKQDKETLRDYMKKETMLSADDMVRLGFATRKIEPIKAVAYFNYKSNKMEEKDVKTFTEKLEAIGKDVKALFSRIAVKDQELTDKAGKKLTLQKEAGDPAVGDKATPDGVYEMESGKTITVLNGVISEVKDAPVAKTDLEVANEKIAELQNLLDAEKAKSAPDLVAAEAAFRAKETQANDIIVQLSALKNTWVPDSRTRFSNAEKVGEIDMKQVKELNEKLKKQSIKTE